MNFKKTLSFCIGTIFCLLTPISAFAEEIGSSNNTMEQASNSEQTRDNGLISNRNLFVSNDSDTIFINSKTISYNTMAEIGEINIEVQRSSNGINGWTTYTTVPNQINYDSCEHYLDHYGIDVSSGYYYRIKLTHYAKEQGWFFPDSQSFTVTSSVLFIN